MRVVDMCAYESATPVQIDVKPGSYPNALNINGNGVIPVAILGSTEFDVTQVVIGSLVTPATIPVNSATISTLCRE